VSQITSGSVLWQAVFVSFALVLILFEVARGWRLGLFRQLVRLAAIIAGYAAAFFGGRMLLPVIRPAVKAPDFVISAIAGAVLAMIVFVVVSAIGRILFKRTGQQKAAPIRLVYGISGAALGVVFGGFVVVLLIVGIRSLGAIADAEVRSQEARGVFRNEERPLRSRAATRAPAAEAPTLLISLARLKNSIELGTVGDAVKTVDVIPTSTYQTLGKFGQVFSNPTSAQRFLTFPGAQELTEHPRIVALRNDPELMRLISHGRFADLLHDQRLIDAANDPSLAAQVKKFEFQRALDYAAQKQ
jgi:uncharacterized membrane protein required for colicin V production